MKNAWLIPVVLLGFGCSSSTKTPIVVYSPHGKELLSEFARQYESLHPDQDVQWLDMGSQDVYDRINTERANPQCDVWWGAPMTIFTRAAREHLLQVYVPSWDSAVPPEFKSPVGYWYGTFVTPEVIMYNTRILSGADIPQDWDDLLNERWKNRIIIRNPLASGTMRIIFCSLIQRTIERGGDLESGLAWLRKLDANTKSYAADPTQLYLKIAREEGALTLWDLPDVQLERSTNGYPFGYVVPESGTPLITDGIAIVKGAKHPAAAKQFYEFVTSEQSMLQQARQFYRIPTRTDIKASELPSWIADLHLKAMTINWDSLAAHEKEWMMLWDERVKGSGKSLGEAR